MPSPHENTPASALPPVRDREDIDPRGKKRDRSWPPAPEPLPYPVIDNHCHLDFADGDTQLSVQDHVDRAAAAGIDAQITIGSDLEAVRWTASLLAAPDCPSSLRGGVAVHPNEAALHARGHDHDGRGIVGLDAAIAEVSELLRGPGMVVVGETGLDWFRTSRRDEQAREAQISSFRAHIALAKELDLPLQIHDRDAHRDVLEILEADGAPSGPSSTASPATRSSPASARTAAGTSPSPAPSPSRTRRTSAPRSPRSASDRCWSRPTRPSSPPCPTAAGRTPPT